MPLTRASTPSLAEPRPGICTPQPPDIGMVLGCVPIKPKKSTISLIVSRIVPPTLYEPNVAPASWYRDAVELNIRRSALRVVVNGVGGPIVAVVRVRHDRLIVALGKLDVESHTRAVARDARLQGLAALKR